MVLYSDHMKANYRYYKWISGDDDSHFIYVKEKEPGLYTVSAFNTSGFSSKEALTKYLDVVKAEEAERMILISTRIILKIIRISKSG